jgi:hypothetical protein
MRRSPQGKQPWKGNLWSSNERHNPHCNLSPPELCKRLPMRLICVQQELQLKQRYRTGVQAVDGSGPCELLTTSVGIAINRPRVHGDNNCACHLAPNNRPRRSSSRNLASDAGTLQCAAENSQLDQTQPQPRRHIFPRFRNHAQLPQEVELPRRRRTKILVRATLPPKYFCDCHRFLFLVRKGGTCWSQNAWSD